MIYVWDDGNRVHPVTPAFGVSLEQLRGSAIPHDVEVVEIESIPQGASVEAWKVENGVIIEDPNRLIIMPQPAHAAMYALTSETVEFAVFSWMRELAAQHLTIAQARADINANLGGEAWWRLNRAAASAGLDASFAALWGACADLGIAIPDGYQDVVMAWRNQFGLISA